MAPSPCRVAFFFRSFVGPRRARLSDPVARRWRGPRGPGRPTPASCRVHAPSVRLPWGGAIDPPDRIAWSVESGTEALGPKLSRSARTALRETWEEVGVLIGRIAGPLPPASAALPIEQAYRERGVVAAMDGQRALDDAQRASVPSARGRGCAAGSSSPIPIALPCVSTARNTKDSPTSSMEKARNR